ncbi:MAG: histidine phosphatase family protein [Coxiellaceae bacterium]|nr:histidine phosphatase family protein [Coxiellaceae bacterium]
MLRTLLLIILFCTPISLAWAHSHQPTLVFASDLIRHGARTVIHPMKGIHYPPLWSDIDIPPAQLTKYGFFEEKTNGQFFKTTYQTLLPKQYDATQVSIRTDGSNRTIMSALAVASQMYPASLSYNIASLPKHKALLLQPKKRMKQIVSTAPGWKYNWQHADWGYHFYKKLYDQHLIKNLCPLTGKQNYLTCFKKIGYIASSINPLNNYCSHASEHCSTTKILHITPQLMHAIIKTNNWVLYHTFLPSHEPGFIEALPQYKAIGLQSGCLLVNHVIRNMQLTVDHKNSLKYMLYSGHDSTVLTVLNYLMTQNFAEFKKPPLFGNPEFAADLSFRLYQQDKKHYQVKIIYRKNSMLDAPQRVLFEGRFKRFKQLYFNQQCLARVLRRTHRI